MKTAEAFGKHWRRVWVEDECLRNLDGERVGAAWTRLYEEPCPYPSTPADSVEDWGDATAYLYGERMVVSAYDGHGIWEPVKCSTCHDTRQLCGECSRPECNCFRSYYRAPPYPCDACTAPEPTP